MPLNLEDTPAISGQCIPVARATELWVFGNPCGRARLGGLIPALSGGPCRARMRDFDLYAQILRITCPWHISDVRLDVPGGKVEVIVEHRAQACFPQFGNSCPVYELRLRRSRHLSSGSDF
jgi:hypothetical protein